MEENGLQSADNGISMTEEEAKLSLKVIKEALKDRKWITEGIFGKDWEALSEEQKLEEFRTSRVSKCYVDRGRAVPGIFVRVSDDHGALVEAFVYPVDAGVIFLREARTIAVSNPREDPSPEAVEKDVFNIAVSMMLAFIDQIFNRTSLWMEEMITETVLYWCTVRDQYVHERNALRGRASKKPKQTAMKQFIEESARRRLQIWEAAAESSIRLKKANFVDHYEELLRHWQRIAKMAGQDERDWAEYAKAGKFADTPDDLLSRLMNIDRTDSEAAKAIVSKLALEHAARRSKLFKTFGVSKWALSKRESGIYVTGYSTQQLYKFLKEGKEVRKLIEANKEIFAKNAKQPKLTKVKSSRKVQPPRSPERHLESAKVKSTKLPERNLKSAKVKSAKSVEQNQRSAKVKKARK